MGNVVIVVAQAANNIPNRRCQLRDRRVLTPEVVMFLY